MSFLCHSAPVVALAATPSHILNSYNKYLAGIILCALGLVSDMPSVGGQRPVEVSPGTVDSGHSSWWKAVFCWLRTSW